MDLFSDKFAFNRNQAFEEFTKLLDPESEHNLNSNYHRSQQIRLFEYLFELIGQPRPRVVFDDPNILQALIKNDIAFRFVQISPLDLDSDFGIIICLNLSTNQPYLIHRESNKLISFSINEDEDSLPHAQNIEPKEVAALFHSSMDVGIQIFSQLPWSLNILRLLKFVFFKRSPELLSIFITTLVISFVQLLLPFFTASVFGSVVPSADYGYFFALIVILIPLSFSLFTASLIRSRLLAQLESLIDFRLQAALVNRVLRQPLHFLQTFTVPDFVLRIQGLTRIRQGLTNSVLVSLFGVVFGSLNFVLMFFYQSRLSIYILLVYILFSFFFYNLSKRQQRLSKQVLDSNASVFNSTNLLLDAVPQIRSTATESFFLSRWAKKVRLQSELNFKTQTISDGVQTLSQSIYQITMFFLIFLVAIDYYSYSLNPSSAYHSITGLFPYNISQAGTFLAFIVAYTSFDSYYSSFMISLTDNIVDSVAQWSRSSPLIFESPELGYRPELQSVTPSGLIEFNNVTYSVDDKLILDNLSLVIKPGQQIGITGPSGSGKSTFIRLISGVILPDNGNLLIDGHEIQEINLKTLRSAIGIVTQSSIIPSTSIIEFLAPSFSYTEDQVWQALKLSCIDDEINSMPMKLQTILSEGASNISGGQRQRLLIAKALIKKPSLLLLDEATSALSEETQSLLIENITNLNITSLSIAHRLETLRGCDKVYIFADGAIVDEGTYSSLSAADSYFSDSLH